ncbi:MAG: folylpolyglutamate synthase/dihydrofolate synthase family protein [Bacteroidia bacterium]
MNYRETLNYLFSQLPMYQRIGHAAYKANLNNTIEICRILGNPEQFLNGRCIHIAGTNGKGSTSHFLASILQSAGYKTGLYTSPHLKDFRERIKINGKMIPKKKVVAFVEKHKTAFEKIQPSFFEMTVGLAFDYFKNEKVDIAIIETGMGGRLDSTNVVNPLLSVITNIGWDHEHFLGNTLPKIAAEKAGIIKPGIPVVIGETHKETANTFKTKAKSEKAKIYFADKLLAIKSSHLTGKRKQYLEVNIVEGNTVFLKKAQSELTGVYQHKNLKTVAASVKLLREQGFHISDKAFYKGLKNVVSQTGITGRWQKLSSSPLAYCDTGHNIDGIKEVLAQITSVKHKKLHFVLGVVSDKKIEPVLNILPKNAVYYFCRPQIPRGLSELELMNKAISSGLKGRAYKSVKSAYNAALQEAKSKDLVFVGGSTFVVAEVV